MDALIDKVAWRRRGSSIDYFGSLLATDDGLQLTGREPSSGVEVALLIPPGELADVHVSVSERASRDLVVVLELESAAPIVVRQVGPVQITVQQLARKLAALVRAPRLLVQGG
jgi:hypothetical protein